MKRIATVILAMLFVFVLVACSSVKPEDSIEDRSLITENGVAYYDVYLKDSVDWWKLSDENQQNIAVYVINDCRKAAKDEDMVAGTMMCYDGEGKMIFSWGGVDGIYEVRYYDEEARFSHNYSLSAADLSLD